MLSLKTSEAALKGRGDAEISEHGTLEHITSWRSLEPMMSWHLYELDRATRRWAWPTASARTIAPARQYECKDDGSVGKAMWSIHLHYIVRHAESSFRDSTRIPRTRARCRQKCRSRC